MKSGEVRKSILQTLPTNRLTAGGSAFFSAEAEGAADAKPKSASLILPSFASLFCFFASGSAASIALTSSSPPSMMLALRRRSRSARAASSSSTSRFAWLVDQARAGEPAANAARRELDADDGRRSRPLAREE